MGVKASLAAFASGFAAARACLASPGPARPPAAPAAAVPSLGPRLAHLGQLIEARFAPPQHATLSAGVLRTADYQDVDYAASYLARLSPLAAKLPADAALGRELLDETARHLALWMTFEDTVRVADLKTRRSRFERVVGEVRLNDSQHLGIHEFLHPRVEEIADTLPAGIGRWLLATPWARALVGRFTRRGRVVQTSSVRGFLLLYAVAALRPMRRRSLRFAVEQRRIDDWLATIERLAPTQPALALEVARAQRLVKGYGQTHQRGWRNFERVMGQLPALQSCAQAAQQFQALTRAALADDTGRALDDMLAGLRKPGEQAGQPSFPH